MITARAWAGKRFAVLGLARSGAASVRALLASGANVVAWDSDAAKRDAILPRHGEGDREAVEGADAASSVKAASSVTPSVRHSVGSLARPARAWIAGGDPSRHPLAGKDLVVADLDTLDLTNFDALVVSPGVPLNTQPLAVTARAAGVPIIGDIELFAQARAELPPHKVVGITGTNGKSTTTALVHHILQTASVPSLMGGNIGLPILGQDPLPAGGVYVLELSSYQIDLTQSLDCDVAVLLNVTPDHLDRYDGFEAYAASKARLFAMQSVPHLAVVDHRAEADEDVLDRAPAGLPIQFIDDVPLGDQSRWPSLQGPHNAHNAAAAIAVAKALSVAEHDIDRGLQSFTGLPHRMQTIAHRSGVAFVDDSKATNPESAAPALGAFAHIHWIVGGKRKGDDLDACAPYFGNIVAAYTIGEAAAPFAALLQGKVPVVEQAGTLEAAVRDAAAAARPGDTVLLSPACASFDQFRDYEARGAAFRAAVEALA